MTYRFDHLCGIPTLRDEDAGDLKTWFRGSLRGGRLWPDKEPRGCKNPISQENLETFWGARMGRFGEFLFRRLQKKQYIKIDVGRKHMEVPTAWIESVTTGVVQHSHRVIT